MTDSYRPIAAPDYASGLRSQYGRDTQNLQRLHSAISRNSQRRIQVAGQGMEFLGALANFSVTAASKYQQVKEKKDAERKGQLFTELQLAGATAQDIKTYSDETYKIKEEGVEQKKIESKLNPVIREILSRYQKPSDIVNLSEYSISQARLNLPGEWARHQSDFGYDPSLPVEKRQEAFQTFLTKGNEKHKSLIERYGIQDASSEALIDGQFFKETDSFFAALNNKAAQKNSQVREGLVQEQRNLTLKNNIKAGNGGNHFVDELKLLGKQYSDGDFKVGLQTAKPIMKKRLLEALASEDISVDEFNNLLDDQVKRGDEVGELQNLYFNEKDRNDFSNAIAARRVKDAEAIEKQNKSTKILTEETSISNADTLITEGKIDEAKTELNNALIILEGDGIKSTRLEKKIASFNFTTENLADQNKELQTKLLNGQLTPQDLEDAYYPNQVEFKDAVAKHELIKNTTEYKNNLKSIKALMKADLVVSGNDSFFKGLGASIHAELEQRYRRNVFINGATPGEAATEVDQHYKLNGGGADGANKGLRYSWNTTDENHTVYQQQLGVKVSNLSLTNKLADIDNKLRSGKKLDEITFFTKGEVQNIIDDYNENGKLNDFARGTLNSQKNKIAIINATAKKYGIKDEIEEPEVQKEFIDNLTPKDRTLVDYKGLENLDSEILLRMLQPRILRPFIK